MGSFCIFVKSLGMEWYEKKKLSLMEWISEHQTGIYITLIVHLLAAIVMLLVKIGSLPEPAHGELLMDFSQQEKEEIKDSKPEKNEVLERARDAVNYESRVRNVAVNEADKKGKKRDVVLDEAENLQKRLDATKKIQAQANQELAELGHRVAEKALASSAQRNATEASPYIGESVISWSLQGRNVIYLPNPVYTCERGGEVEVGVIVNRRGYVQEVSLSKRSANVSPCIAEAALRAAKQSRFSSSGQDGQSGYIRYRFMSQP
jgi:hypothetical protein